jgi:hypothetical protein
LPFCLIFRACFLSSHRLHLRHFLFYFFFLSLSGFALGIGSGICYRYHLVEYTVLGLFTARCAIKTVPGPALCHPCENTCNLMLWVGLRGLFLSAEAACLIYTSHAISLIDDRPSKPAAPRHSWRIHILSGHSKSSVGATFYLDIYSPFSSMCSRSNSFHINDPKPSPPNHIDNGCRGTVIAQENRE